MHTCFHSVALHRLPIEDVIARLSAAGYSAIELNAETLPWANPHVSPETDKARRVKIKDSARDAGIAIDAIGAKTNMIAADKDSRKAAIRFVEGCIDLAEDLGAPVVHVLSGPLAQGGSIDEARRWFAEAIEKTVQYGDERGVQLGIEAIAGHAFRGVDDYHRLAKDLPGVRWRVLFDPSHFAVQDEDPARIVDELADRICHVHLKDGKGRYPEFEFPPIGTGVIDFERLVGGLRSAGYHGSMSIEDEAEAFGYRRSDTEIVEGNLKYLKSLGI